MPLITKPHAVLSAGEAIDADVRCQSCIQSSTTLAHACLLIRRGDTALAGHVLDTLEQAKNSPFRDIIAYFRAWIEMETQAYSRAKADLLEILQQQPGDSVALSLLQACLVSELGRQGVLEGASAAAAPSGPAREIAEPPAQPPPAQSPKAAAPEADPELEPYQATISDSGSAFVLWKSAGSPRITGKPEWAPLASLLAAELPGNLSGAVSDLEGGTIRKICFAFQSLTVATWHAPGRNAGLVTGPHQQALLAMVRVENAFLKQAAEASP